MSEIRFSPVEVDEQQFYDVTHTSNNVTKKNDVTTDVSVKNFAASLPISCDVCHDDVTPKNVTPTTNDITTSGSLKLADLKLDNNVASHPISCDVGNNDVIITQDASRNIVSKLKKEKDSVESDEENEKSVNLSQDFSFWIHVDGC